MHRIGLILRIPFTLFHRLLVKMKVPEGKAWKPLLDLWLCSNAQSVATQFDFVASWLMHHCHAPVGRPPADAHHFPPIKCTCRSMFTVTFIRRRSAFFSTSHKKFPANTRPPALPLPLPLPHPLVWPLQLFHLSTPPTDWPRSTTGWRNFLAIYLTASSCRRCCGCKSALAAACHSSNQVLCGCHKVWGLGGLNDGG